MSLAGKCAIVTAGGSGIGRAIAEGLADQGAAVHICDRDPALVSDMTRPSENLGATIADVADPDAVDRMFQAADRQFGGRLDILVNNAGIAGPTGAIEDMAPAAWAETFQVNVQGAFHCLRRAVPIMKAAGSGAIINIASTAGTHGFPLRTPYAASKWALIGLTKSLAMELGPFAIRVNAICPGSVRGARMDQVITAEAAARGLAPEALRRGYEGQVSMRRFIDAEDIADMAAYLASDKAHMVSGQIIAVDGNTESLSTVPL